MAGQDSAQDLVDLYTLNSDGSGSTNVSQNPVGFGSLAPEFNRNTTRILFLRNQVAWQASKFHVWTMNLDGTGKTQLTMFGSNTDPNWRR